MKIVVGLGNSGFKYTVSRHNVGYAAVDCFVDEHNLKIMPCKFSGVLARGPGYVVGKPTTFMNLSGTFVGQLVRFYKASLNDLLVVHDDMDLPLGCFAVTTSKSAGGHNGVRNVFAHLNTTNINRVRVGIGRHGDTTTHVLGTFTETERIVIKPVVHQVSEIIDDFLKHGISYVIDKYKQT